MRKQILALVCVFSIFVVACGGSDSGSPTSPSANPSSPSVSPASSFPIISGTWDGTHEMQFFGERTFSNVRINIEQQGRSISKGEWVLTSPGWDVRGNLTGRIEGEGNGAHFVGTTTMIAETASGTGRCNGTAVITSENNFNGNVMRLVGPDISFRDCRNDQVRGIVWIFHR